MLILCLFSLATNPCMGGESPAKMAKRYIAPKEYNQTEEQNFRDDMERRLEAVEKRG
jgi:hypothetical protein